MEWVQTDKETHDCLLVIIYEGSQFDVEALTVYPRLVVRNDDEDEEKVVGIEITVMCGELELNRELEWGVPLVGNPNESPDKEFLDEVVSALAPHAVYQAHVNVRVMLSNAEQTMKDLREAKQAMSFVTLEYKGNRIRLSLALAQQVLFIKYRDRARASIKPFRLQRESESVAVVFDERDRVMGRMGFNPEERRYRTSEGRFGVFNYPDDPEMEKYNAN